MTQYTLAMDRGHKDLRKTGRRLHPSVLCLIDLTCKAAAAHGRWWEFSAAPPATLNRWDFNRHGVTELSVSIPALPLDQIASA